MEALGKLWDLIGSSLGHPWMCFGVLKWFGRGILGHMRVTVGHLSGTDDTLEPLRRHFGTTLGSFWGYLGLPWDHFKLTLGYYGVTLGLLWVTFKVLGAIFCLTKMTLDDLASTLGQVLVYES